MWNNGRDGIPVKKLACLTLALCLLAALPAQAETELSDRPVADGVVAAAAFVDVTAPYSGTLLSFDLDAGDAVAVGDALFAYQTQTLYAPEAGTVKALFAAPGDDAAAVTARYGALLGLEPDAGYLVAATTDGAYKENENKMLHLGEMLYMKTSGGSPTEGTGRVVAVTGDAYTVEVLTGDFDLKADVTLYRRDSYVSSSGVGKGKVNRREALALQGAGRVAEVLVAQGAHVAAGTPLLTLVSADAAPDAYAPLVSAGAAGVVEQVFVSPGQQVYRGQALCRIGQTDAIEVRADVDEADLDGLKVGDALPVTLDMYPGQVLMATVTQISGLGETRQNAAYFTVHAAIATGSGPLGASASLYLPKK